MKRRATITWILTIVSLLTSCYSFDKKVALKEFKELKPNCHIVEMIDHECDGTLGSCWYVEFKYKIKNSETVYDTTLQYWEVDGKWITRAEYIKRFP
jgi:hypothetical protein